MVRRIALFFIGLGFIMAADVGLILALNFAQVPIKAIVVGIAVFTVIGVAALVCLFQLQVMIEKPRPLGRHDQISQSRQSHARSGPIAIPEEYNPKNQTDLLNRSAEKAARERQAPIRTRPHAVPASAAASQKIVQARPVGSEQPPPARPQPATLRVAAKPVEPEPSRPMPAVRANSGYRRPSVKERPAISVVPSDNLERLSIADLMEEVHKQGHAISALIRDSQERIAALEAQTVNRIHLTDAQYADSLMNAQRIVHALEARLERLKSVARNPSSPEFFQAKTLLTEELYLPRDAVNALINSRDLPPLPPSEWGPMLDRLLTSAEESLRRLFG